MNVGDAAILIGLIASGGVLFCLGMLVLTLAAGNKLPSSMLNLGATANRRVPTGHKRAA